MTTPEITYDRDGGFYQCRFPDGGWLYLGKDIGEAENFLAHYMAAIERHRKSDTTDLEEMQRHYPYEHYPSAEDILVRWLVVVLAIAVVVFGYLAWNLWI